MEKQKSNYPVAISITIHLPVVQKMTTEEDDERLLFDDDASS